MQRYTFGRMKVERTRDQSLIQLNKDVGSLRDPSKFRKCSVKNEEKEEKQNKKKGGGERSSSKRQSRGNETSLIRNREIRASNFGRVGEGREDLGYISWPDGF